ncbi:phosphotransferase family protein [Rhodococcus rhodochrous]|uniref:phosphotransferase family protein n=1 Tax=Rhodococcus rhodochrous TaxID=1829 RepID=UPI000A5D35FB|nr:phosphotransferase family protein [Rhodococcus rhodochrous]
MTELREALGGFLADKLPDHDRFEVSELRRLGGGSSQENWSFDLVWTRNGTHGTTPLLLRREPESGVVDTARHTEFELLRILKGTEVPVPEVHWLEDGTVFGRPSMIVERRHGSADRGVLRDTDPLGIGARNRLDLAAEMADLIARVHGLDVEELGLGRVFPDTGKDPGRAELERWEAELDRVELEPQPALRFVARWLRDNLPPPPERITLVHGDFRPANILVRDGGLDTLLDWELAHLGDPADDLGWYTCSVYAREHFLPDRWAIDDFLARYTASAGGAEVDAERLRFWQVMSTFRLAIIALTGVRNFCDGQTDRPATPVDGVVRRALTDTGLVKRRVDSEEER